LIKQGDEVDIWTEEGWSEKNVEKTT
jgi:hypothetical protein